MYDITLERETTGGDTVTKTYEGVVDYMDPPGSASPRLKFKGDDTWTGIDGFGRIARVQSPLA